jgi:hypothetical protein
VDPGEDFDQRAFACTVLARERMNLAGVKAEGDPAQHLDGAEALGDATKLNRRHARKLADEVSGPCFFAPDLVA